MRQVLPVLLSSVGLSESSGVEEEEEEEAEEEWVDEECDTAELLDLMLDRDGTKVRGDAEKDYEFDVSL
jgi:hypothetical protein